jgi:type IV pilus assembly protein PilQ
MGTVTIRLVDVPWEKALDVILKTYGFAYEKVGNIITVAPVEKLTEQKKKEADLAQIQPTVTEVFNLKFIDAADAKKALEPFLSNRGKITVLETTGQAGWEFGTEEIAKRKRVTEGRVSRSKTLIVTDVPPILEKIREVIKEIDTMPQQILIETRIMEVNRDRLKDIGFDWGTGITGAESPTIITTPTGKHAGSVVSEAGGHILGDQITPSIFGPKEGSTFTTEKVGLKLLFRKLTGTQFEAILHALEEDVRTNILSAPRIMTLNNQEAAILIGTKYPIIKPTISVETGRVIGAELDKYQDIGIQLNVVPQISKEDYINMIIHPAISSYTETVKVKSATGETLSEYPIINVREAETQILIKDGETVVIGGLLKDVKSKEIIGVPILSKIPLLGLLFQRRTTDIEKIDLLIFITAHIVKEGVSSEEIEKSEERLDKPR